MFNTLWLWSHHNVRLSVHLSRSESDQIVIKEQSSTQRKLKTQRTPEVYHWSLKCCVLFYNMVVLDPLSEGTRLFFIYKTFVLVLLKKNIW